MIYPQSRVAACYSCLNTLLVNQPFLSNHFCFVFDFFKWILCRILSIHSFCNSKLISFTDHWLMMDHLSCAKHTHSLLSDVFGVCFFGLSVIWQTVAVGTHSHRHNSDWRNMHLVCIWLGSCRGNYFLFVVVFFF